MNTTLILLGLIVILFTGVPIFAALSLFGGAVLLLTQGELGPVTEVIFGEINRYMLVTIPLFAFMGHIMIRGKIVDDLYSTAYTLTKHLPGGLGFATIVACTIFAAISGSSVATALTVGAVAIPQMIKFGYEPRMAYGLVAAGGTLGILIPPSGPMVLYGVVSDTSIGGLFMAGVVPGLMMAAIFAIFGSLVATYGKSKIQRETRATLAEALRALMASGWAFALPALVLGGMYSGVFTATEAAAMGALAATLVGVLAYRTIRLPQIWESALDASRTSAMLFLIVGGASVFGHVLTKLRIPQQIIQLVIDLHLGPTGFLIAAMVLILMLGMVLESIAIILITTPVLMPVIHHLGINPIWYGILLTINLEVALIHPPVGMNLFTIKAVAKAPMGEIIMGTLPYVGLLILGLLIVMAWPQLALWLPAQMLNIH